MSGDREVHDVAIVVFARVRGYDAGDAADAAALVLRQTLGEAPFGELPADVTFTHHRLGDLTVRITGVKEVGTAARNGYLHVRPTNRVLNELGGPVSDEGL